MSNVIDCNIWNFNFCENYNRARVSGALRICVQYGGRLWSDTASERGLQCLNMSIKWLKCLYIYSGECR